MIKNMKKIISILLVIVTAATLVSCGLRDDVAEGAGRVQNTAQAPSTAPSAATGTSKPTASETKTEPAPVPTGKATYSGTEAGGDLVYTTFLGNKITDFSFLDGLSKNFFSDTGDLENGSWYCGKTVRDDAGNVTVVMERAADVLDAIDRFGAIYRKNEDKKIVYFTFDCGYETGYTGQILDILKEKDVRGAFFLNGQYIKSAPELVKRMLDEGHIVGNHGNNHQVPAKLPIEEVFYEIESNNELLQEAVPGAPYMRYFRPAYGSCSAWDMALVQKMDLTEVLYSWTYYDYDPDDQADPAEALAKAKEGLHNGSVLMFHTVGSTNVQMLGDFIDYIRAEGFEIGCIDE